MMENDEEEEVTFHWMEGDSLAPPCQTDYEVLEVIMHTLQTYLSEASILYDLGCGDGRICLLATERYSCKSVGVEIEPLLIERFHKRLKKLRPSLQDKVIVKNEDLLKVPFEQDADVIVLYLLPEAIKLIEERIVQVLQRGGVVLCQSWGFKSIRPTSVIDCGYANTVKLLLYTKASLSNSEI